MDSLFPLVIFAIVVIGGAITIYDRLWKGRYKPFRPEPALSEFCATQLPDGRVPVRPDGFGIVQPQMGQPPAVQPQMGQPPAVQPPGPIAPLPGDVAIARDPRTDPGVLLHMANNAPQLRPYLIENPVLDRGLHNWLCNLGDPAINDALARMQRR
ncbi:hypothetical protein HH308_19490 [Gordonia sp. TBRC 11910]|uniref:Leucine rich repeat variant domain-containing protein n=1 Tax=Gordonia asplenii TaxID=2725283 RepID=A0A848KYV3_9ACTN|nr:hypothetical protein [Gordonia asplenii]NMO03402.1 hypothetical protein [Gordonia asplenii]